MTPAEVIAMRDQLATEIYEASGQRTEKQFMHALSVADWLIKSGWVVAPPKNEGEISDRT